MRKASKSIRRKLTLLVAAILAAGLLCYPLTALTVRHIVGWFPVWAFPAASGDRFQLTWTHTVSQRLVSEAFFIDSRHRLCLKEMVFDELGPGLPSYSEDGTVWTFKDGKAVVTGYDRCWERLNLGVSPLGHRLEVADSNLDLVAEIGSDRLIIVSVERIPVVLVLLAEVSRWWSSPSRS